MIEQAIGSKIKVINFIYLLKSSKNNLFDFKFRHTNKVRSLKENLPLL
jgi:hypothetical protein